MKKLYPRPMELPFRVPSRTRAVATGAERIGREPLWRLPERRRLR